MGIVSRIVGLMFSDIFVYYVMWMMMIYLTDVWKLDFTVAAAIVNIWRGSVLVMPVAFAYIADAFLGNFCVLLLTSLSYAVGFVLLWMSTPPVLAKANGNCSEYKPECIQDVQKHLFFASLALTSVGLAGHLASLSLFMAEQTEKIVAEFGGNAAELMAMHEEDDDNVSCSVCCSMCCTTCRPICEIFLVILLGFCGFMVVLFVKSWGVKFGVCALFAVASLLVFLTGVRSYKYLRPQGSAITTIFRVVVAAFSKLFCRRPRDVNELYEKRDVANEDVLLLPNTNSLRCLDKAAIILPKPGLEQQAQNRWRLCSVTEVESTKTVIKMVPLWMTLIFCGVVSAIGDSFFLEQAKSLNPKLGRIKMPLIFFVGFYDLSKNLLSKIFVKIAVILVRVAPGYRRYIPPAGVAVAMIFSILCCTTAAKIESKRLQTVKSHGLIEKPDDERVPMSMFWLMPQFLLLGGLDGIREWSVSKLVVDQAPTAMAKTFTFFSFAVYGIGIMGSALSVQIVGKMSRGKSGESWFQSTLNKSRLDKYYRVLATLSAANLLVFIIVSSFYKYKDPIDSALEEPQPQHEETETNYNYHFSYQMGSS